MNIRKIVAALLAASIASSGFVFAQGRGDRDERRAEGRQQENSDHEARNERDRREADADMRRGNRGTSSYDRRDAERRAPPGQTVREERRDGRAQDERRDGRGAGPGHAWYRGDRLPAEYRHRSYVVDDWRGHQLSAPPRGYQWVQTGSDFVLIAIASGIIAQLILGN